MIAMSHDDTRTHDTDVIHLAEGLVGLPDLKRWVLLENDPPLPIRWLASLDRDGFRVPVTEPGWFDPDYAFELDDRAERSLEAARAEDLAVLIVTTVGAGGESVTGNLAAPIVVNIHSRKGLQYILDERKYSLHAEIDSVRFGLAIAETESDAVDSSMDSAAPARYSEDGEPVLVEG